MNKDKQWTKEEVKEVEKIVFDKIRGEKDGRAI